MLSPYTQILAGRVLLLPAAGTENTAEDEVTGGAAGDDRFDAAPRGLTVTDDPFDVGSGGLTVTDDPGLTVTDDPFDVGWLTVTDDPFDVGWHVTPKGSCRIDACLLNITQALSLFARLRRWTGAAPLELSDTHEADDRTAGLCVLSIL
jgi:hypothetical protein